AFAKWYFSRYVWLLTWVLVIILVPLLRIATKIILNKLGLWLRETWIIGSGKNAREAYKAIYSEKNLGLGVIGYVSTATHDDEINNYDGIPIVKNKSDVNWLKNIDRRTQFIVAVEASEGEVRNKWLREFMIKGYRYVSVIPTLRGVPL
ncbi:UDP-phosphate galactose phosphotransferase, partial [Escherichia coli]